MSQSPGQFNVSSVNGAQQCDCWRHHSSSLVCVRSVACLGFLFCRWRHTTKTQKQKFTLGNAHRSLVLDQVGLAFSKSGPNKRGCNIYFPCKLMYVTFIELWLGDRIACAWVSLNIWLFSLSLIRRWRRTLYYLAIGHRSVWQQLGFLTDHTILAPAGQGERRQEKGWDEGCSHQDLKGSSSFLRESNELPGFTQWGRNLGKRIFSPIRKIWKTIFRPSLC